MFNILIDLLILAVVLYVANLIIDMLTLPAQVKTIALLIIGLIGLVLLLNQLGVSTLGLH